MGSPGHDKTFAVQELMRKLSTALEGLVQGEPVTDLTVLAAVHEEVAIMEARVLSMLKCSGMGPMDPATVPGHGSLGYESSDGKSQIYSANINFSGGGHRRRGQQYSWRTVADSTDDGYSWRKYGRKYINGTKHPRSYFKCPHNQDRGCCAKRQVQPMEDDPSKFVITYIGDHCCKDHIATMSPNLISTPSSTVEGQESRLISFQLEDLMSSSPAGSFSPDYFMLTDPSHPAMAELYGSMSMVEAQTAASAGAVAFDHQAGEASSYVGSLDMGFLGDTEPMDEVFSFDADEFCPGYYSDNQFPPY